MHKASHHPETAARYPGNVLVPGEILIENYIQVIGLGAGLKVDSEESYWLLNVGENEQISNSSKD